MSFFKNLFKGKNTVAPNPELDSAVSQENPGDLSELSEQQETAPEETTDGASAATHTPDSVETVSEVSENTEVAQDIDEPAFDPESGNESEEDMGGQESETSDGNTPDIEEKKAGFFQKVFMGLDKTRKNLIGNVENVLKSFTKIDDDLFEELEEVLIMADVGVETSTAIIEAVKDKVRKNRVTEVATVKSLMVEEITEILKSDDSAFQLPCPAVILVIGVNGVGKTTTIGKLAHNFKADGKKVMLAAADTFRAAAIDQLEVWGQRNSVDVIKHQENSDPGAVVFDAVKAAKARKTDILICDTAGRLHNKKNLMEELKKIYKIIHREFDEAHVEVLLVLDATTGQNALQQAKLFKEAADITGIVLTKLDGTAKGGIVIAIKNELKIPVRYIGVGESIDDLQEFNAGDFAKALFGLEDEN